MPHGNSAARTTREIQPIELPGTALSRLRWAVRFANRVTLRLERHGVLPFVVLSALYWAFTITLARRKLMWNDELYTYYIARLPSMHDVWAALMSRGEQLPPFFYMPTRLAIRLLGVNNLSVRLPEMLGFWVMSACLFVFVARRTRPLSGLSAAALPLVTTAYYYSFEARPYGLLLGFAAMALLSWQAVTLTRRRTLALLALVVSLTATVCTHYYGVFVILPLALGEAVLSLTRRRVNVAVWAALAASVVPLAWHLPLIRAGAAYSGAFWSPPQWVNLPDFYADLLAPAIVPIAIILFLAGMLSLIGTEDRDRTDGAPVTMPLHELAAACSFAAIPVVCVIVAKVATGAFVNRYAVPAIIGIAVLGGVGTALASRRHPVMRLLIVGCLAVWFALLQAREFIEPTGLSQPFSQAAIDRPVEWLAATPEQELPVVVADPHSFTVLSHYGPPALKSRIVYLADPDLALKYLGHNSVERGMLDLIKPWFGMHVVRFQPFMTEHHRFLVYGDFVRLDFLNWLVPELHARGMHTELLRRASDNLLLLVYDGAASVQSDQHDPPPVLRGTRATAGLAVR